MVVEDCLLLLLNLLRNNVSNQNFMKEGSYIQRLPLYFDLKNSDRPSDAWSAQKVTNVHLMLEVSDLFFKYSLISNNLEILPLQVVRKLRENKVKLSFW